VKKNKTKDKSHKIKVKKVNYLVFCTMEPRILLSSADSLIRYSIYVLFWALFILQTFVFFLLSFIFPPGKLPSRQSQGKDGLTKGTNNNNIMSFNNLQVWQNWNLTKPDKFKRALRLILIENL
jgi:hypothetical protein